VGQYTYLIMELGWALPVIALQWVLGWETLLARRRLLVLAIAIPTLYLSSADALAIRVGIWKLNPERTLDLWVGALPIEEAIFFFLTNTMVVQGLILFLEPNCVFARIGRWRAGLRRRPPS
jgi:lycopene cyclase domain-containing protein